MPGSRGDALATIREALLSRRDRLLANPRFHRAAARLWPLRGIARREARALFDLCAGFVYAQILHACIELDLFERLAAGPLTLDDLARDLDLRHDAVERLVDAAVSLRLLAWRGHDARGHDAGGRRRVGLGMRGAALRGNPGVAAMVRHHAVLYADLADPVGLLRRGRGRLADFWPYAAGERHDLDRAAVAPYSTLMAASQAFVAEDLLDAYPFTRHRQLLDVGGGDGTFLASVAAGAPALRLALFDLPAVAALAAARLAERGLSARATAHGGDFLADPLPGGADLISLVRIVHDHDDRAVATLLARIHRALTPGGTLLIAEPFAGTSGAEPVGAAYFGFYLLAMGSGRARRPEELRQMLSAAGFAAGRAVRMPRPLLPGLITARKPRS